MKDYHKKIYIFGEDGCYVIDNTYQSYSEKIAGILDYIKHNNINISNTFYYSYYYYIEGYTTPYWDSYNIKYPNASFTHVQKDNVPEKHLKLFNLIIMLET